MTKPEDYPQTPEATSPRDLLSPFAEQNTWALEHMPAIHQVAASLNRNFCVAEEREDEATVSPEPEVTEDPTVRSGRAIHRRISSGSRELMELAWRLGHVLHGVDDLEQRTEITKKLLHPFLRIYPPAEKEAIPFFLGRIDDHRQVVDEITEKSGAFAQEARGAVEDNPYFI